MAEPRALMEGQELRTWMGDGGGGGGGAAAEEAAGGADVTGSDAQQLRGEHLANDPDWQRGLCWVHAYHRMHRLLLERAREIQADGQQQQANTDAATGQEGVTIASSLRLLRREVFALCPLGWLYTGMAVSVALTVMSFTMPYVQGRLIDHILTASDKYRKGEEVDTFEVMAPLLTVYALLTLGSYVCEILVGILFAICGHTTVTRLRIKLFRNLTVQEIAFYDAHVSGELSSRLINDSAALSSLTQFTTQTVLGAFVKFGGSLVAMYCTHWELALLATMITPLSTVLVRWTGKIVGRYGVVQNHAMAKANAVAIEVLGSIRTVQANGGERSEALRFMHHLNYYLRVIKATVYIETVLRFTQYGLSKARNVVVLAVALHQVVFGRLTIGGYTAFAQYVTLYEDGFKSLADVFINFKQTITATGKFVQLLTREASISPEGGLFPPICNGKLCVQDVCFSYAGRPGHHVLKRVSFQANPGDIVALVGESGAGKTTVGRLLLRYYDPSSGEISIDGQSMRALNLRWLRAQIGFVEQEPILFDRPIHENIAYGAAEGMSIHEVERAARRANAHNFISELGKGYDTHPGERAVRISGGQKQRVAIARAVIRDPKVLLLDEATSALDSENEAIVQEALDKMMEDKTTIIIAHRLSTVKRATNILVLDRGVVIEQGTHEKLMANEGSRYASFMRHQEVAPLLS